MPLDAWPAPTTVFRVGAPTLGAPLFDVVAASAEPVEPPVPLPIRLARLELEVAVLTLRLDRLADTVAALPPPRSAWPVRLVAALRRVWAWLTGQR